MRLLLLGLLLVSFFSYSDYKIPKDGDTEYIIKCKITSEFCFRKGCNEFEIVAHNIRFASDNTYMFENGDGYTIIVPIDQCVVRDSRIKDIYD